MTLRVIVASMIVLLTVVGCGVSAVPTAAPAGGTGIGGTATAGPVCPVERIPPDPACAPRPVNGAVLVIADPAGREVARVTTAEDGTFFAAVPPGRYVVAPQPAAGLMGIAPGQDVDVAAGATTRIEVVYDTGIRGPATAP